MATRRRRARPPRSIVVVRRSSSSPRSSSGLKRRSTENHAVPGTTLKFAPLPDAPPTTSIEPRASSLSSGYSVRRASSSCARSASGSAIRTICSKALTPRCACPTCAGRPSHADAQGDRAAAGVPDDAAGRLGGEHRERAARRSSRPRAGSRSRRRCRSPRRTRGAGRSVRRRAGRERVPRRRRRACSRARPSCRRCRARRSARPRARLELRARLGRHDVEVPVEVDRPPALPGGAADDARLLQARGAAAARSARARDPGRAWRRAARGRSDRARDLAGSRCRSRRATRQRCHLLGALVEPRVHLACIHSGFPCHSAPHLSRRRLCEHGRRMVRGQNHTDTYR